MSLRILCAAALLGLAAPASAKDAPVNPKIDYNGFAALIAELAPIRAERRIALADFLAKAEEGGRDHPRHAQRSGLRGWPHGGRN